MTKASTARDTVTTHRCGFASKPTTSGAAAYALSRHSCQRWLDKAESKRRGDLQRMSVDRTPKPCLHKVARHEHGTRACYVLDQCRCLPCAQTNAATERHRQRQTAYGRWQPYVDAEPTRQHVLALRAAGMGAKRIAAVSGVPHGSLAKLIYGDPRRNLAPSKRIRWETAIRLQVVRADISTLTGGAPVPAIGTQRRLQALVAIGWSQSKLGERIGMDPSNVVLLMKRSQTTAGRARRVAELYAELWDTPAVGTDHRSKISVNRARGHAARMGWLPPMAWADVNIDDPAAHPNVSGYDPELVDAVMAGALVDGDEDLELNLTALERLECLRRGRLTFAWHNTAQIARRLGLDARQLYRDEAEQRRPAAANLRDKLPPAEDLQFLLDNGLSIAAIADRYGASEDGVEQALRRHPAA